MRVVATKAFKTFHNHVPVALEEGQEASGVFAAFLLSRKAPVKRVDADPEPEPVTPDAEQKPDDGPPTELDIDASADDVMAWVDEDPDRAEEALEAEQAKDKPRSTLVKKLEKLTESE